MLFDRGFHILYSNLLPLPTRYGRKQTLVGVFLSYLQALRSKVAYGIHGASEDISTVDFSHHLKRRLPVPRTPRQTTADLVKGLGQYIWFLPPRVFFQISLEFGNQDVVMCVRKLAKFGYVSGIRIDAFVFF